MVTKERQKKAVVPQVLLDKARYYCALTEQCETAVRQKLINWGATSADVETVVASLRADDYLNDMRYARLFAESKILHHHWGRQKVLYQLRLKRLPNEAIAESMKMVDEERYNDILAEEAEKKLRLLGGEMTPDTRRRLTAYLVSRGFTLEEVNRVV